MGWKVVIMDTVKTSTTLCYSKLKLEKLQQCLSNNQFVHGDLRYQNLLIDENAGIKLLILTGQEKLVKLDIH